MIYDNMCEILYNKPHIPKIIENSILDLFNFDNMSSEALNTIKTRLDNLFYSGTITNYNNKHKEYALKYLPENFYKLWQPLLDLLKKNQLLNDINVIEFGTGPGTSTFSLLEFYKMMALKSDAVYHIKITIVEKEKKFISIFDHIYKQYVETFPKNLQVIIVKKNFDLNCDIDWGNEKYDLFIESNMLNSNEEISSRVLENIFSICANNLLTHSSFIMIEPAKMNLHNYIDGIKTKLYENGMNKYSPCVCNNAQCKQFSCGKVYVGNSIIYNKLRSKGMVKNQDYHYYRYEIIRKDKLTKYDTINNRICLSDLKNHINEYISFSAYVIACVEHNDEIGLQLCDGTLANGDKVWMNIPKGQLKSELNIEVNSNKGEFIKVKKAKIESSNKIVYDLMTSVKIER